MSQAAHSDRELLALIGGACDTTLTSNEATRLESLLRGSVAAQQCFQSYMLLDAELHWREIGPSKAFRRSVDLLGDAVESRSAVQFEHDDEVRSPLVAPAVQLRFWGFSALALKLSVAAAVAVAFWLVLGVWMLQERRSDQSLAESKTSTPGPTRTVGLVASLVAEQDCRWSSSNGTTPNVGATFAAARMLELESGRASLEFADGAQVTLEGPCQFLLRSSGSGRLERGRLAAQVPPQAVGFTVETPTSRIVDLGTEFDVEVLPSGATNVQVIKGKVDLFSGEKRGANLSIAPTNQPTKITAGEAFRVESDGRKVSAPFRRTAKTITSRHSVQQTRMVDLKTAVAMQSTNHKSSSHSAQMAIDGNLQTSSHTDPKDSAAWLQIDLGTSRSIGAVMLFNRPLSGGWMRDITMKVLAEDGTTVVASSPKLNPKNSLGAGEHNFEVGPSQLVFDFQRASNEPTVGRFVRIEREPCAVDIDRLNEARRTDGEWIAACKNALSLSEVQIFDCPMTMK